MIEFHVRIRVSRGGTFWPVVRKMEYAGDGRLVSEKHHAIIGLGFPTEQAAKDAVSDLLDGSWRWA